jgi:uncharacterized protein
MPEYLAPGVYVEETSFRAKSIEGVSTSTTGFAGPTRKGPVGGTPELITSFGDFERIYGGAEPLEFGGVRTTNYLAHSVRAYFDNGGSRLYVSRAFTAAGDSPGRAASDNVIQGAAADEQVRVVARFPGAAGNGRVTLSLVALPATERTLREAPPGTFVRATAGGGGPTLHVKRGANYVNSADAQLDLATVTQAEILTLTVEARDAAGALTVYEGLALDRAHARWIGHVLGPTPSRRREALENLFALEAGGGVSSFDLHTALFPQAGDVTRTITLSGGNDGAAPQLDAYRQALAALAAQDDISIVAAPGYSALGNDTTVRGVQGALISHAEQRFAYRIAVLDSRPGNGVTEVGAERNLIDSKYAAIYFPWVIVANPDPNAAEVELSLPPSGFVCGIYARNDIERGVAKTPANEVVRGALRFESQVNFAQQEVLNPRGVNCLRYLSGRGLRVWGGRTISSDPEWKYVNVRRYFNYLEHSIDNGTQWAVFENNGERLWANVRDTVASFLYNEWSNGALLGSTPKEAFFVRCDRSTMTQNDLDNGRLVCLIGVAVLKPAEFVIFRIGQKTADSRN